jgi:hypothetical protein
MPISCHDSEIGHSLFINAIKNKSDLGPSRRDDKMAKIPRHPGTAPGGGPLTLTQ